jgi:hypothetical protein
VKTYALRRRLGRVTYVNRVFGRIMRQDTGRRVFFHRNDASRAFRVGDYTTFLEASNEQFGMHATDIKPANHERRGAP